MHNNVKQPTEVSDLSDGITCFAPDIEQMLRQERKPLGKHEDPEVLDAVERLIAKKRGYVFRMPQAGEGVVLAWSGGPDSTTVAAYLMEVHGLKVFPYYVKSAAPYTLFEELSQTYFQKFFIKRYGGLFYFPVAFHLNDPLIRRKQLASFYPMVVEYSRMLGLWYADFLTRRLDQPIKTVLYANTAEDANDAPADSLTSFRVLQLSILAGKTGDDLSWQITALPLERSIGLYIEKPTLIKVAARLGLPLEHTRSCIRKTTLHCGECAGCMRRKTAFKESGLMDPSRYLS